MRKVTDLLAFTPAGNTFVDYMCDDGKSLYAGQSFDELKVEHPDLILVTAADGVQMIEKSKITPVQSCTQEQFKIALEALPPLDWKRDQQGESFKMSEFHCYQITRIYVRIRDTFYTFMDRASLSHQDIVSKALTAQLAL